MRMSKDVRHRANTKRKSGRPLTDYGALIVAMGIKSWSSRKVVKAIW